MTKSYSLVFKLTLLLGLVFSAIRPALAQEPIEPDPVRLAVLWHKMSGTMPSIEYFVRKSPEYLSAQEIDREQVFNRMVSKIRSSYTSVSPENDRYVIRIPSNMSAYDPRAGGFFLPLFSGRSFVPIAGGPAAFSGQMQLHFINPEDFVFWPMPEAEARAFMNKAGQRPRVTARFVFDPVSAPPVPFVDGSDRIIYGQVTKVELLDRRNQVLTSRVSTQSTEEAEAAFRLVRIKPTENVMAMMWHKIVGGPQYNDRAVKLRSSSAMNFSPEDIKAYFDRFYDELDPTQPFTMLVAAEFGAYDAANGEFPLKIDEPIQYKSFFPYATYPDDQVRVDKVNEGKRPRFFKKAKTNTVFSVDYENDAAVGGLKIDAAGAARLRSDPSQSYRASALLTVVPIKAETLENFEKTGAKKVLHTKIARALILDRSTGQVLIEKTFDVAALPRIPHETVPEGKPAFDGTDPYTIDFRNIKLGMTEAEMRAAAGYFREVRTSPKFAPGYMKLFAKGGESLGVTFCTDDKICSMAYSRRWQDAVVRDVYDATIEKYGQPVGGRAPYDTRGRGEAREASMTWTRNFRRVGGLDGSISLVAGTTYLKITAVDRTKTRKKKEKPKISLD